MEESDAAKIKDVGSLGIICQLLQVDSGEAEKALCSRVVATRMEAVEKGHTVEQAQFGRDALCKVGQWRKEQGSLTHYT